MKAIITGGSSGLGFEIARLLREKNMDLILIGTNKVKLDKAVKKLEDIKSDAYIDGFAFDISDEAEVKKFYGILEERQDKVGYLFNVAGRSYYGNVEEISHKDIMTILNANMIGLMLMTAGAVRQFKAFPAARQRIVSVLSTAALKGKKQETVYNASKWGARGFLESVRDELANTHIDVINVCPGGMYTPFWDNSPSGYEVDTFMSPEDVARQIVAISTDYSTWISDITINRPRQV